MSHLKDYQDMLEDYNVPTPQNGISPDRSKELREAIITSLNDMRERWRQTMNLEPTTYADGTLNGLRLAIDIVYSLTLRNSKRTLVNMGGD